MHCTHRDMYGSKGKKGTKSSANLSQGSSSSGLPLPCFEFPVACMSLRTHTAKLPAIGGRKDVVGRPGCLAGYGGKSRARLWLWASLIKGFEPSNSNHDLSPPLMLLLLRVVVYLLCRMHVCPKESYASLICILKINIYFLCKSSFENFPRR